MDTGAVEEEQAVFEGVEFTIIPGEIIEGEDYEQLRHALTTNGAKFVPLREDNDEVDLLDAITHIISTHVDFPQYNKALDLGVLIVKPSWVATSLRKGKRASERQHSPDPSQFFQDVVVTMGDLPDGDKAAISGGVIALGGQYSNPLSKLTTHLVTMSMNDVKCQLAVEKELQCKIVVPHWFDDCLKLGKRISEYPYQFPDPKILRSEEDFSVRAPASTHMAGAAEAILSHPPTPRASSPPSPAAGRRTLNAFKAKAVMISQDVDIAANLRQTLASLIVDGGGVVVEDVSRADILICQYRDGHDYITASQIGKEVANLAWLYHVINRNRYSNPQSKLLHYPVPREPLPGFKGLKISISSYTGDARIYVENLVKHCGAEFTKTMKQDNTHLITARSRSEKVEAAQEWNINIINHLWLEESYAKCALQPLGNPRYIHFPTRTNLSEVVGRTSLDMDRVEHVFFPRNPKSSSKKTTASPQKTEKRPGLVDDSRPNDVAVASAEVGGVTLNASEADMIQTPQSRVRSKTTPRLKDDEKENETPTIRSIGRASKAKALDVLSVQAHDIAQFQREMKRKGGVVHGGRRSGSNDEVSTAVPAPKRSGKRTSEEMTYEATNQDSELSDGETQPQKAAPPSKKSKQSSTRAAFPPVQYKVMVTGYDRWTDKVKQTDQDKMKLRTLGIQITDDYKDIDVLVAPKILRTRKFVCALASAPRVVGVQYLDSALKSGKLEDDPPLLDDQETEKKVGFKLCEAIDRAKVNARHLLRGWSIFVTKDIQGGFDTYKDIITANGGEAYMYAGRTGLHLPKRRVRDDPDLGEESQHQGGDVEYDYVYLVSGESSTETKLWKTFRELAAKQDVVARVVKSDWLIIGAMSQTIRWDETWELHV